MKKQNITETMKIHEQWYKEAKTQTLETLPQFISHLLGDYVHDYGTICHALAAGGIATMWAMNNHPQGGITGFQAGAIMWEFIRNWNYEYNKCGLKIVDYDNMLYPQYKDKYAKTINKDTWEALQKAAQKMLNEGDGVCPKVKKHWESIVAGDIPFGYKIKND
jgi:hypothetical protein